MRRARRRTSSQALALRSRIVLECATGDANTVVAQRMGVSRPKVGKWRSRYVEHRLDGLVDDPRPGWSATVTAEQVEDVVVATLESAPENATHWSRAKMAERNGLSKSTIGRVWKAFGLKPHRTDGFKLSNDPLFVEKVYDIVGLYLDPPESAVVPAGRATGRRAPIRSPSNYGPLQASRPGSKVHSGQWVRLRPCAPLASTLPGRSSGQRQEFANERVDACHRCGIPELGDDLEGTSPLRAPGEGNCPHGVGVVESDAAFGLNGMVQDGILPHRWRIVSTAPPVQLATQEPVESSPLLFIVSRMELSFSSTTSTPSPVLLRMVATN